MDALEERAKRDREDMARLQQILAAQGTDWDTVVQQAQRTGQALPLGDWGRALVEAKRADERWGTDRLTRFRTTALPDRGWDALFGALRIAEMSGGGQVETPSMEPPPFGALSHAQQVRARNPMIRLLDRFGRAGTPPRPLPPVDIPSAPGERRDQGSDLGRLRSALAQNAATIPGIQDPRMGIRGPRLSVSRRRITDLRRRPSWALIEAQLPFPLEEG